MRILTTAALVAAVAAAAVPLAAQELPRTPWGHPDLQGIWSNTTTTPLQRPEELAGRTTLTAEERSERDAERERNADRPPPPGQTGAYNSFWFERGVTGEQTSLVVDPPTGLLPPLTPAAAVRADAIHAVRYSDRRDWTTDFHLYDRCLTRGLPGGMMPGFYNHNYNIMQTPDYVVIQVEMIHDSRIIPLDGRPHLDPSIQQWLGSSRGRWEGDTLVVETTNLSAKANEQRVDMANVVFGIGEHARIVERFTRLDDDSLDYRVTVIDPTTYQTEWTAAIPMVAIEGPLYEYACHEGNYALRNMLSGARAGRGGGRRRGGREVTRAAAVESLRAGAVAAAAILVAAPAAPAQPPAAAEPLPFVPHTIATGLAGAYQAVAADLNADGRPDVIALSTRLPELVWYENPGWERHVIAAG